MAIKNKHFYAIVDNNGNFVSTNHDYYDGSTPYTVSDVPRRIYDDEFKATIFANFINDENGKVLCHVIELYPQVAVCYPWGTINKSKKVLGELYAIRKYSSGLYVEHDGNETDRLNRADMLTTVQALKKKFSGLFNGYEDLEIVKVVMVP